MAEARGCNIMKSFSLDEFDNHEWHHACPFISHGYLYVKVIRVRICNRQEFK